MTHILQQTASTKFLWGRSLSRLASVISRVCTEFNNRRRLNASVGKLFAKNLRDIGLTENDVTSIDQQSFLNDSVLFLIEARNERRENW